MQFWVIFVHLLAIITANNVYFYEDRTLTIQNVGEHFPYHANGACVASSYRWIPVVDQESNDAIQGYTKDNGIPTAWLGLMPTYGGNFAWLGIGKTMDEVGYSNWANGDIKNGYVYMDSESGTWKTALRPVKKTVLCVSISRACKKDGKFYADGFEGEFDCQICSCSSGYMNCKESQSCIKDTGDGCYSTYNNKFIPEGEAIDIGCRRCTCVKKNREFTLSCTECQVIDRTIGTEHETRYRQQSKCPPIYRDKGFKWVDCTQQDHTGCNKYCELPDSECRKECVPRCACPPDKPFLSHGFCKPECPGRRFTPVIIQGPSNRVLPETGEDLEIKCTSIGEPTPEVKLTDIEFEPDLENAPTTGQFGIKTVSTTFKVSRRALPVVIYCYAWNINGVSKSSATLRAVSKSDSNNNPSIDERGQLKMPPVVRLGVESLALGKRYGQRMKCVATGAPKPEVQIVKIQDGIAFPSISANAKPGLHDVIAEATVLIDSPADTGVYACMASNKHGAVKDEATLSFVGKAASPGDVGMLLKASGFVKDDVELAEWPFMPSGETQCSSSRGMKYDKYQQWKEDCNTCTCLDGGKTYCTNNACEIKEDQCTGSDGVKYDKYQKWKEDCNTCTCLRGGRRYCTDNVCEIIPYNVQCRWFGGNMYNVGEEWTHGCRSCFCHESGRPACGESNCKAECSYNGRTLAEGTTFTDNCRTCRCTADGSISCEGNPCPEPKAGCIYNGQNYAVNERFKDGCKTCRCRSNGLITCNHIRCLPVKKQCIFQKVRKLPHGTQLQVECNICACNDGTMTCSNDKCPGINTNKVGCSLEGEQTKYRLGSVIQMGNIVCTCLQLDQKKRGRNILDFVCN